MTLAATVEAPRLISAAKPNVFPARLDWLDSCKGICITLVIYGHITGGLETSGIVAYGSAYDQLRSWVYLFHMPAFFFLSGLLGARVIARPFVEVFRSKLRTIAFPYILWTGIYLAVQAAFVRFANNPPDISAASQLLWKPYGYGLWFLYSLFLISLLFHCLMTSRLQRELILVLAAGLHIAAAFNLFAFWPILNQALLYLIYYAVGGLYSRTVLTLLAEARSGSSLACALVALGTMTLIAPIAHSFSMSLDWLPAFFGIVGVVCLARGLAGLSPGAFFSWLGLYSLEIYLGHPLFGTASRALLTHGQIHSAVLLIISGVILGIFGSITLAVLCRHLRFPYLYRWHAPDRAPQPRQLP